MAKNKRRRKDDEHMNETWLIPYADMLTLLLALFVVLFSMSSIDAAKFEEIARSLNSALNGGIGAMEYPSPIEPLGEEATSQDDDHLEKRADVELEELKQLQQRINAYIDEKGLGNRLSTNLSEEGLKITILDEALFDSGSAVVKDEAHRMAVEISNLLISDPPRSVVISGHTDNVPIHNADFRSNWDLSVMRAVNFMSVLLENDRLEPALLSAKGYGEYQPIASNDSSEGRAKNRRVEVLILPNYEIDLEEQ